MHLTLVTPLRTPFSLPKDEILANHDTWRQVVKNAHNKLAESVLPEATLGNYGWGQLSNLHDDKGALYGTTGISDPGWFFKEHYLLRITDQLTNNDIASSNDDLLFKIIKGSNVRGKWEVRIIDNTVAVFVLDFEVLMDKFLEYVKNPLYQHAESINNWARMCVKMHTKDIEMAVKWCHENLIVPVGHRSKKDNVEDLLCSKQSLVYSEDYHCVWTHRAYVFTSKERDRLSESQKNAIRLLLSSENSANKWFEKEQNVYGWGATAIVEQKRFGDQWLDALCASQYYYTCIDRADTALPISIATQRSASKSGHHKQVHKVALQTRNDLNVLLNDYADLLVHTSSQAFTALNAYYNIWRMRKLIEGMNKKLKFLEELITTSSDEIDKKNQRTIQYILISITLLSVIGLFTSLHDYLADSFDPRLPEWISTHALYFGKGKVLIISILTVLLAFFAFVFLNKNRK